MNLASFALVAMPCIAGLHAGDWRHDLLKAEGYGTSAEEWTKRAKGVEVNTDDLLEAYRQLGSDRFPERETAQKMLLKGGVDAQRWLRALPPSPDPEIRIRVAEILDALEFPSNGVRERMIRHALGTLLDGVDPAEADTGGVFYEWFGVEKPGLESGYRLFDYEAEGGMDGLVRDGKLRLAGDRPGDGDQQIVLKADRWPSRETFPDQFTVSAKLGGTKGGSGAWHLGIGIGKVRVLFHPDYRGGGFRFEKIGSREYVTSNEDMGFTPSTDRWQHMRVKVRKARDGRIELAARVEQEGEEPFETSTLVDGETIGPIDQVSLDRSGRTGGDALFDDFVVEFHEE